MSEGRPRAPQIAMALAIVAVVLAVGTAVIVLRRSPASSAPGPTALEDRAGSADAVVRVPSDAVAGRAAGGGASDPADALATGIVRRDDHHAEVPRVVFDQVLDQVLVDPQLLGRGASTVPAIANGRPDGFTLVAIPSSSWLTRLGFERGDTIRAINGFEVTSPGKLLELAVRMRRASLFTIDLMRQAHAEIVSIKIR